jgi:putative ABC transport system permease protein
MAAYGGSALTLTGAGEPEQLIGTRVSSGYFAVVGVAPVLGRSFLPEEYETGKDKLSSSVILFGKVVSVVWKTSSIRALRLMAPSIQ